MKLFPKSTPWTWPGIKGILGQRFENAQRDAQILKVHAVLQSANQNRDRAMSVDLETIEHLLHPGEEVGQVRRCQSEEPNEKKRKHFVVDTVELKRMAEEHILSARRIKSADKKAKSAKLELWDDGQSNILSLEQRVQIWKDKAKAAAARDAQRPQLAQKGPLKSILIHRDEHEKKQQETHEDHQRQLQQVNLTSQTSHMGRKPSIPAGFQPVQRLGDQKPKPEWVAPRANASAGPRIIQMSQSTPHKPDNGSEGRNGHSHSPIDVEQDMSDRQRKGSAARSGHSQTLNEASRSISGGNEGVVEFRNTDRFVQPRSGRPRQRLNGYSNGSGSGLSVFKKQDPRIANTEDAEDPIHDSESDLASKPLQRKNSNIEVLVESYQANQTNGSNTTRDRRNQQHDKDVEEVNLNKNDQFPPASKSPFTSPHFPDNGEGGPRRLAKSMEGSSGIRSKDRGGEGPRRKVDKDSNPDASYDELSIDQLSHGARNHREIAEKLVRQQKSARAHELNLSETINVDDSDDDSDFEEHTKRADIRPTRFRKDSKGAGTYELRQFFSREKTWLCDKDNETWTLKHHTESRSLEVLDVQGNTQHSLGTKLFNTVEFNKNSSKVVIHRHRDNSASNPTHVYLEFSNYDEATRFCQDIRAYYNLNGKSREYGVYFDRVFDKASKEIEDAKMKDAKPNSKSKRPREEDMDDDVKLLINRTQGKYVQKFDKAQGHKRVRTDESVGSQLNRNEDTARPKRQSLAESMKSDTRQLRTSDDRRSSVQSHALAPKTFYGSLETVGQSEVHGTRSSTRVAGASGATARSNKRRSPSPELPERWTKLNPGWKKEHPWPGSIIYPPEGKNRATVDQHDIYRLDEGEFLNDNLIIFYLRYLEDRLEKSHPEVARKIHFYNSFFFAKLSNPPKGSREQIDYKAVEKWTSKVDIFDCDYIVVPVNENLHWYVAIICHPSKLLEAANAKQDASSQEEIKTENSRKPSPSADSGLTPETTGISLDDEPVKDAEQSKPISDATPERKEAPFPQSDDVERSSPPPIVSDIAPSQPTKNQTKKVKNKSSPASRRSPSDLRIITFDSFHLPRSPCCTKLKKYLVQELKMKRGIEVNDPGAIGMTAKNIPGQNNSSDCGLFLLSYIEKFLEDPDEFIKDIHQNPVDLTDMNGKYPTASKMRERVRDLLFKLEKEQFPNLKPEKNTGKSKPNTKEKSVNKRSSKEVTVGQAPSRNSSPTSGIQDRSRVNGELLPSNTAEPNIVVQTDLVEPRPIAPDIVSNGQLGNDSPHPTPKQSGIINHIYTSVTASVNSFLGRSRTESESVSQRRDAIETEDSTQNSPIALDYPIGKAFEVPDSQATSSQTSSVVKNSTTSQERTDHSDPIVILDSPERLKTLTKPLHPTKVKKTSKVRSPSLSSRQDSRTSRLHEKMNNINVDDVLSQFPALGSPLVSPSPEPADVTEFNGFSPAEEDEIDLISPFRVPEDQKVNGNHDDHMTESEMLLSNGLSGAANDAEISSSSSASTSVPSRNSDKVDEQRCAPPSPGSVNQELQDNIAVSPKGNKRKTLSDEDEHTQHYQRLKSKYRGGSPEVIEIEDEKLQTRDSADEHKDARKNKRRGKEHGQEPFQTSRLRPGNEPKKQDAMEEGKRSDIQQRLPSPFRRDGLDQAIIGNRGNHSRKHTRFP